MLVNLKFTNHNDVSWSTDIEWCPCCDAMFGDPYNQYIWAEDGIEDYVEECNLCNATFSWFEEGLDVYER